MDSARQVIRGFGGIHINSWQGTRLNADLQEKAFDNDPGEMGLSILRLQISPDSNSFGNELDIARYAVSQGAIVFASPWDPPGYMLDPGVGYNRLHPDYYDDYADHLNQFYYFMTDSGVPVYGISVQNEPDYGEWTQWTAEEMTTFLKENGQDIETRVIAPESFQFRQDYSNVILNDAEAAANVDIIGGHIYGGGLQDYPLAREMGKELWMTEHLTGSGDPADNTWGLALGLGAEINACMQANFNAYVWWYIRRFYGLITDDGNISKKGYVMSQFSKFIQPGAVRIDAALESAAGVVATAFKTDTSLVFVMVNTNSSPVSLDFTIENNSGIDTLTKFTTSANKNVLNDGGVSITGDAFTASLDPYSVTTFTSWADAGGRFGNYPPVANAGPDIKVEDSDGGGTEIITLDGRASADLDGTIVNYSWSLNGDHLAWGDSLDIELPIGMHTAVLTATDNDGASTSDTLEIEITSIFNTELWAEAECVIVGSTWEVLFDEAASNGVYVGAPLGTESVGEASADTADHLIYTFHLEEPGPYKVWGRVIAPSPDDDSYWVKIDDSAWAMWNNIPSGNDWHWDDVHDGGADNPVVYQLDTGYHELSICFREDGTYLDKLLIVNTGNIPDGEGGEGLTCTIEPPEPEPEALSAQSALPGIRIFPNPADDQLNLQISYIPQAGIRIVLYNLQGQTIISDRIRTERHTLDISSLEEGVYLISLRMEEAVVVRKILVR
jgi:glucuronoarabinoxylan endo-1,4-beta-xylanase